MPDLDWAVLGFWAAVFVACWALRIYASTVGEAFADSEATPTVDIGGRDK